MLSRWKASQTSGPKAKQTLKLVWKSLQDASKAEQTEDEEKEKVSQEMGVNSTSPSDQRREQVNAVEPEDMEIFRNSDSDGDKSGEDIDLCGGSPSTGEQCSVALSVNCLSLAWELGKALRLDDDVIVGYVAPPDSAAMNKLALQLLKKWWKRVGSQEKTVLMTKLLQDYNIQDCNADREISDQTLVALGRQIAPEKFYEIGEKLGFNKSELLNIEHRTLNNRKDANIQMLSKWKASQSSGPKAKQTLQLVLKSLEDASKAEKTKDEEEEEEDSQELEGNSTSLHEHRTEQRESVEPDDMEIIRNSDSDGDGDKTGEVIDLCGGSPSTHEQCIIALSVNCLSLAWELGKALRLDDDVIVGYVAPSNPAAINRLAWQLLNKQCRRVGSQEKTELMTKLFQDYNIQNCNAGHDEISRKICTTPDLLDFSQRLDLAASEVVQVMSTCVSFPPTSIRHIVLQMLQEWVRRGGTRQRLLEISQAFHFNDAADKIATEIERHPGFLDPFSHGIIDHDGGELKLDELDMRVSIPAGAIPKETRSMVTLRVPSCCLSKIPLKDGEVLITPVIECSFTQELLKPATVALPQFIHPEQHQDDLRVSLYTKLGPGTFGHRSVLPNTPRGFHISEDVVDFPTHHLQQCALSSSNFRGVQYTCEVHLPLFMTPSQKSTLRICIAHPCNRYPAEMRRRQESLSEPFYQLATVIKFSLESKEDDLKLLCFMRRRQESLSEPFYQLATVIKFSLESKEDDLKLLCLSDSEKVQETVPVRGLLKGECNTLDFELMSSPDEGGAKSICLRIEQGTSTLAEQHMPTSIEVEPDYGASQTFGQIKFASDNMLKVLSGVVCAIKDARDLGYQLGFSHSTVEKYLDRADSSGSSVSSSGFREMLCDWRRCVRPNEQVSKLRLALEKAGLSYAAEVLLPEI
eukprot:XP_011669905.1 PREDICTED: uncharacterized protein LOC105440953 [Strongylocentrotus purpuratus]